MAILCPKNQWNERDLLNLKDTQKFHEWTCGLGQESFNNHC